FGILDEYIGHGIGREMHEEPPVFNYQVRQPGIKIQPGLVVAIEPILSAGETKNFVDSDGWSVRLKDGRDGCQWENSVAVHEGGIWVITEADGGAAGLAPFGVVPTPIV